MIHPFSIYIYIPDSSTLNSWLTALKKAYLTHIFFLRYITAILCLRTLGRTSVLHWVVGRETVITKIKHRSSKNMALNTQSKGHLFKVWTLKQKDKALLWPQLGTCTGGDSNFSQDCAKPQMTTEAPLSTDYGVTSKF